MPSPNVPEGQIGQLVSLIAGYIAEQQKAFQPKARPIGAEERRPLQSFFPPDVLDGVRVVRGRAPEPKFYALLRVMGIHNPPPFADMAGITFQDVVVHVEPLSQTLLFHELVHVVQYKHLGLQGFADAYVRGFLKGGSYEEISLEKQAYELEARFAAHPEATFSVDEDVQLRIRSKRF
jgi:hypothetical protein